MLLLIILALLATALTQEYINNVPLTFSLTGNVSYIPSSGGIANPGYNFTVGFDRYSWLGTTHLTQAYNSKHSHPPITTIP